MKKALVHDWYTVYGGAEKCVESFTNIWNDFDHYSLIDSLSDSDRQIILKGKETKNSFIQKLPFGKTKYRNYLPFFPLAIDLIKENYFVLGEGLGQGKELMLNYIIEKGDPRKIYNGFDLHNQYLTNYLEMGILGILSLLYLIFYPLLQIKKRLMHHNLPIVGFSLLFFLALFTEASLYLIKGIIIFAVFSSVFLKMNQINITAKKQ